MEQYFPPEILRISEISFHSVFTAKMQEDKTEVLVCNAVSCFFDCDCTFYAAPILYLFYGVYILDMKQKDWNKKPKVD